MTHSPQAQSNINWPTSTTSSKTTNYNLLSSHSQAVAKIHRSLKSSQRVFIGTHEHPDGDAIGSSLALMHALCLQNKQVTVFAPHPAPDIFSFLPGIAHLTTNIPFLNQYDVIVLLDATTVKRTHLHGLIKNHPATVCIDHHFHNVRECALNLIIPEAAATAYILTLFFQATHTPITKDMATCLLTGIFTDTGSFMHDSTSPEIMKLTAFLMTKGARLSHIAQETYQKKDLPGLKIWGRALSRATISQKTGATVSVITTRDLRECDATLDDLSGVVNVLNTLSNSRFALLLVEYKPGRIKGSLRSEPHKGVDVSQLAQQLGGGGHKLAAGFEVQGRLVYQNDKWRVLPASKQPLTNH